MGRSIPQTPKNKLTDCVLVDSVLLRSSCSFNADKNLVLHFFGHINFPPISYEKMIVKVRDQKKEEAFCLHVIKYSQKIF
jgi:hypothetical protein